MRLTRNTSTNTNNLVLADQYKLYSDSYAAILNRLLKVERILTVTQLYFGYTNPII